MVASAGGSGAGVEVGVLVEGEGGVGVEVAENVSALATVVTPCEVVESAFAVRVIADCGFRVRLRFQLVLVLIRWSILWQWCANLPVLAARGRGDLGVELEIPFSLNTPCALNCRSSRQTVSNRANPRQAQ